MKKIIDMKRRVTFKKPFARLQKIACTALSVITLSVWSCQNDSEPLSDHQISINLSKKGKNDPKLLIGEWDDVMFAYTADGKKIRNETELSLSTLTIPFAPTPKASDFEDQWRLSYVNSHFFDCSLSRNLIVLEHRGSTSYKVGEPPEFYEMFTALVNAYSFVVKGDELMIHFIGDKMKNLLILRKRDPHDLISSNLIKNGTVDRALLFGEYDCVKFAYTADGNTISDRAVLKKGRVSITERVEEHSHGSVGIYIYLSLFHSNTRHYSTINAPFDIRGQFIRFFPDGVTQNVSTSPQEEMDLDHVFRNVYSFVIRNNELIIHFQRGENKNLLILKKR